MIVCESTMRAVPCAGGLTSDTVLPGVTPGTVATSITVLFVGGLLGLAGPGEDVAGRPELGLVDGVTPAVGKLLAVGVTLAPGVVLDDADADGVGPAVDVALGLTVGEAVGVAVATGFTGGLVASAGRHAARVKKM